MVYKHDVVAAFRIYAKRLGWRLYIKYSNGNYIVEHGKSWKNHGIAFLNFCGKPSLTGNEELLV